MDGHNQSKPPKIHRKSFQTKDRYNKELEVYVKLQSLQGECIPRAIKGRSAGDLSLELTRFQTILDLVVLNEIVITRVVDALARIHAHDVLHFDIKPQHIFYDNHKAFFIDFDLAKILPISSGLPFTGKFEGTTKYASLNQHLGMTPSVIDDWECLFFTLVSILGTKHTCVASIVSSENHYSATQIWLSKLTFFCQHWPQEISPQPASSKMTSACLLYTSPSPRD
eukprot:TRINITY_DN4032_c0_g1_i1.p1 TRINITY_DN4032_c0_g1~~TRINITY_DN4032_c0_g1_i1.p1  ORF type:complete len:225 (+),score=23.74 TRINITY_DN4032_c0_g1_i1:155-829(+)